MAIAREVDDPALLARVLTACGCINGHNPTISRPYFVEALGLARAQGDVWRVSQILGWLAYGAMIAGDTIAARAAGEEGLQFAEAIGDRFVARQRRWCLGLAHMMRGETVAAVTDFENVVAEADAAHDTIWSALGLACQSFVLAWQGETIEACAVACAAIEVAADLGGIQEGICHAALGFAALARGDGAAAEEANQTAWQHLSVQRENRAAAP